MKKLILIAGPMGVGKTTVANLINKKIENSICLEGDAFWNWNPEGITEEDKKQVIINISNGINKHLKENKYQTIIFTWIMHQQFIIDSIINNLDLTDTKLIVVTLDCNEITLVNRIKKDINDGKRKIDVIKRSLLRRRDSMSTNTVHIDTSSLDANEVADKILEL